ncbi:hypothetical protein [Altericroceibacterium xinjiangense]|uniref:hypothetical protein n=1 Tax=Altericroceibacterium xinjiangense TaxID=762261 RepID=UPI000F7F1347|nr:hypothetical protein [Altericroceibacterium xinjiangense]
MRHGQRKEGPFGTGDSRRDAINKGTLILLLALTACSTEGPDEPVQTAELTGFYEGQGDGERRAWMCMVSAPSGPTSFGIVTLGPGEAACSGAGEAAVQGEVLNLAMTGDEECVIQARITGDQVAFPATLPESCAYYCSPGASLGGKTLEKTGGTAEDALNAADLAGGRLCG